jgi:hypothetical protein
LYIACDSKTVQENENWIIAKITRYTAFVYKKKTPRFRTGQTQAHKQTTGDIRLRFLQKNLRRKFDFSSI